MEAASPRRPLPVTTGVGAVAGAVEAVVAVPVATGVGAVAGALEAVGGGWRLSP